MEGSWFLDDAEGKTITIISRTKTVHENPEPGVRVMRDVVEPHADGNAALFFAAPKMLEVLGRVEMWLSTVTPVDGMVMRDVVRDAISMATTVLDAAAQYAHEKAARDAEIDAICGVEPPKPEQSQ